MKKQPAKINYFFRAGYIELWGTIKDTFCNLGGDIVDAWEDLACGWSEFWGSFFAALASIFSFDFEFDWEEIWESIKGICHFAFALGKLVFLLIVTTSLCAFLSLAHILILMTIMLIVYALFMLLLLSDKIFRMFKHISSNCSNCQNKFGLPIYVCPGCGVRHDKLCPSKYGIWKRTCECGERIPTTFFNGRGKLEAHCPHCDLNIKDGGMHRVISIPVVGGASAGKTCLIHQALARLEETAGDYSLEYEYSPNANGMDDYEDNMNSLNNGRLPDKTSEMRLKYYQFYLQPANVAVKKQISLCDVGGEVYSDSQALGEQIGYKHADGFLLVMDPLSIDGYKRELVKGGVDINAYGGSADSADAIASMLINTLENMFGIKASDSLKVSIAVAFSKGDLPGLSDKIGESAVAEYLNSNPEASVLDAQNAVCEAFLNEYDEQNFINSLKSKFTSVQFFCSSALGHNMDGTPFVSTGVEDPVLWLIDKVTPMPEVKKKWNRNA